MITQKTVFVLGAGASCPYGFPDGETLFKKIIDLKNDYKFRNYLKIVFDRSPLGFDAGAERTLEGMVAELSRAKLGSIDSYLFKVTDREFGKREDIRAVGKFSIAYILDEIQRSIDRGYAVKDEEDWLGFLYNDFLLKGVGDFSGFLKNEISFITFNYELTIERFFEDALSVAYGSQIIPGFFEEVPIFHVHGKLGRLEKNPELETLHGVQHRVNWAKNPERMRAFELKALSEELVFVNDETPENSESEKIAEILSPASKVFFLGFGYNPDNVTKLGIDWKNKFEKSMPTRFYGTAFKKEDGQIRKIAREIGAMNDLGNPVIKMESCGSRKLLEKYADMIR